MGEGGPPRTLWDASCIFREDNPPSPPVKQLMNNLKLIKDKFCV